MSNLVVSCSEECWTTLLMPFLCKSCHHIFTVGVVRTAVTDSIDYLSVAAVIQISIGLEMMKVLFVDNLITRNLSCLRREPSSFHDYRSN